MCGEGCDRINVLNDPINFYDPYGLYSFDAFLQDAANFSAGFGDTITFGGTAWIRDQWTKNIWGGIDGVDKCSDAHTAGKWSGYAWEVGMGAAALARTAGYQVAFNYYPNAKGAGINLLKYVKNAPKSKRIIGIDWHRFKLPPKKGPLVNRPHIDSKPLGLKHWPWMR